VDTPPSINLSAPAPNSVFQAGATILLSAGAADTDGNVVRVDFYQGGALIGSASAVPYSFAWTNVGAGSYSLTAVATDNQGSSTASAAVTVRVNALPDVALTSPTTGTTFTAPATIPLAANASDSDGTITRVDFFQGTTPIGTATNAPYTFNWTNVGQGSYALTAVATDNDGAMTTSAAVNVTVNSGVAQLYYIVPDHLNTPRLIADSTGTTVWRWDQGEPFGNDVPNNNPTGAGAFDFPLRFPGQYFDRETNLHYNYFRDYDPVIGRYVETDPLGIDADGIARMPEFIRLLVEQDISSPILVKSLYLYVLAMPINKYDRFGLEVSNTDQFLYPPTTNCTCTINCRKEVPQVIKTICSLVPSPRIKIRDARIRIPGPQQICENAIVAFRCVLKCADFCSGKCPNNPYPDK
jgi:RHS repeat-associated protein